MILFFQTNVQLPLPAKHPRETLLKINETLKGKLLDEANVYVAHFYHVGQWWCRASAQTWNEVRAPCQSNVARELT